MTMPIPPAPPWAFWCLRIAAVYNVVWGLAAILFPSAFFLSLGIEPPNYPALWQCLGMVIGVYGVGYWIAAEDPATHWPIVLIGLLGKIFGPIGFVWSALWGEFPWSMGWTILANDLVWWLPFTAILLHALRIHDARRLAERARPLAEELQNYKLADGQTLWEASQTQPLLVVFLRHSGCTFCREAVAEVGRQKAELERRGVRPVFIHMSDFEDARKLAKTYGAEGIDFVSDPARRLYHAFDLSLGTLGELFSPSVWWRGGGAEGVFWKYGAGPLEGNGLQKAGVFLLDHGEILRAHRHKTSGDRIDYLELACPLPAPAGK